MSTDPFDIKLSAKYRQILAELSKELGASPSDILEDALESYQGKASNADSQPELSLFDAATKIGAIGISTGEPSDLSTNKEYFDGFGTDS